MKLAEEAVLSAAKLADLEKLVQESTKPKPIFWQKFGKQNKGGKSFRSWPIMASDFAPKGFSPSDELEDESVLLIKKLLKNNKAVKAILGGNDKTANKDGVLELRNDTHTVGNLAVQLKPVDAARKKGGRACYQLPGHMIGYSQVAGLPFILICYDRDQSKAYWKKIDSSLLVLFKDGADSTTLEFQPEDEIDDSQPYSRRWFEISNAHLTAMKQQKLMGLTFEALRADKAFGGSFESPVDLAELMKRLLREAGEKYKNRLEVAKKHFDEFEITASSTILEELATELGSNEQEKDTYFDVLIWLGNIRYRLEKLKPAEDCFQKAYALDKTSPRAQTNLAHIFYVQNENKEEALRLAKSGWEARPKHESSLGIYMMCLNYNKANSELEALKKEQSSIISKSSVLQLCLGQIAKENTDFKKACNYFKEVLKLDSTYHHARIIFAECAYRVARKACLNMIDDGKEPDPEACKSELDDALKELKQAIEFFSGTTDKLALHRAYDISASIKMLRGKFEDALSDCEKMDAVISGQLAGQIVRAQLYMQFGRFADIVELLKPHAESNRQDVAQALGYSHYRLNQWELAVTYFKKYVTEEESSDSELLAYVQCLWFSNNKREAYLLARKLRVAKRATKEIMQQVELTYLRETNQFDAGSDVVEDLIKVAPNDVDNYIHRISINVMRGQQSDARENYKAFPSQLLENDPWAQSSFRRQESQLRQIGWI